MEQVRRPANIDYTYHAFGGKAGCWCKKVPLGILSSFRYASLFFP
ncbi:MAG: hypothetical protein N2662_01680 [Bacteroidales bacterium]|nr:hypothetical protein [Bacteroidales bacterium]